MEQNEKSEFKIAAGEHIKRIYEEKCNNEKQIEKLVALNEKILIGKVVPSSLADTSKKTFSKIAKSAGNQVEVKSIVKYLDGDTETCDSGILHYDIKKPNVIEVNNVRRELLMGPKEYFVKEIKDKATGEVIYNNPYYAYRNYKDDGDIYVVALMFGNSYAVYLVNSAIYRTNLKIKAERREIKKKANFYSECEDFYCLSDIKEESISKWKDFCLEDLRKFDGESSYEAYRIIEFMGYNSKLKVDRLAKMVEKFINKGLEHKDFNYENSECILHPKKQWHDKNIDQALSMALDCTEKGEELRKYLTATYVNNPIKR